MILTFVPMLSAIDLQVWLKEQMFVAAGHWIPYEPPFLAALDTFLLSLWSLGQLLSCLSSCCFRCYLCILPACCKRERLPPVWTKIDQIQQPTEHTIQMPCINFRVDKQKKCKKTIFNTHTIHVSYIYPHEWWYVFLFNGFHVGQIYVPVPWMTKISPPDQGDGYSRGRNVINWNLLDFSIAIGIFHICFFGLWFQICFIFTPKIGEDSHFA